MVSPVRSVKYNYEKNNEKKHTSQSSRVVKGNFPVYKDIRELSIFKFNRFLSLVLLLSIVISMVSYSIVIAKESVLSVIHSKTNDMNFENLSLQNKVDHARSFYNINDKAAQITFLQKPDKILEIEVPDLAPNLKKDHSEMKVKPISGY